MFRRFRKLTRLLPVPSFRRGLRHGVAASIEHKAIIGATDFRMLIDIGANRGQFSLLVRGLKPDVKVIAFEPLTEAAQKYEEVHSDDSKVRLERYAIGDQSAEMTMNVAAKIDRSSLRPFGEMSNVFPKGSEKVREETVQVRKLSDVLKAEDIIGPCLCKIDVQGFELEVLHGCMDLFPKIDFFYVECGLIDLFEGQAPFSQILSFMEDSGYCLKRMGHVSGSTQEPGVVFDALFARA